MRHFGMVINLIVLLVWVLLLWIGMFLIFSSDPESIITKDKEVASFIERLYFTGFVFSTLGTGDIQPNSNTFRLLTSIFSFLGFSFFTTSITYLLSVSSAFAYKRSFSQSIRNFGNTPDEVWNNLFSYDPSFLIQHLAQFQNMMNCHAVNHQAYPVLNYFNSQKLANSLHLNLAILDEAISMYLHQIPDKPFVREIQPLRKAIDNYISQIKERHIRGDTEVPFIDWGKLNQNQLFGASNKTNEVLAHRRRKLSRILFNDGFSWADVYKDPILSSK